GLLELLASLPFRWLLPDLALAEIRAPDPQMLLRLGMEVATFSGEEIATMMQLRSRYPNLALADCANLLLAQRERALLITGDRLLRRVASHHFGLRVHGSLWLLDRLVESRRLTEGDAAHALRAMLEAGRRLPHSECQSRLQRWQRGLASGRSSAPE
ncbi:MAG: DUF3368 domain-containing protein, partial [Armatimonadetes bacterium]|nr:DUF3368 domain-containing protein [Armatimonadota bacterium]